MTGKTILHYNILEKLGEGGMGVVYKAEDTRLKRIVALKFLPGYVSANDVDRQRFKIEAQSAASLNHPNITIVHSIEETDDAAFIAMEYIDGKDLKYFLKPGTYNHQQFDQFINFATQISDGLEAAQKKGVVHRDIKSQNIMITNDGQLKIMDFGLAKLAGVNVTKVNQTAGTLAYISPEQLQGRNVDYRTDIWSFGVVLYEMLTGTLPFHGDYEAAIIYSILNEEPKAINISYPDIPENLINLVSSMLQKDPERRISSYSEIRNLLKSKPILQKPNNGSKSIAVLYFENMSPDKENEYFCAGITEDLIIDLSRIKDLKVISRSDVLPFRNKEVNSRKIGELLKVPFVLEGSVRKAGQKIRIAAELIDVNSGFPVWAERYDRSMEDIFEIQVEVSQKIANALKVSLTENEKKMLGEKPTADMRAYDFYLRGRELISRYGKRNNEAAIQMFEYAISIDPYFALAYAGLAEACSYQYIWYDGNLKWLGRIIEAGEKALKLDPDAIEVKFIMGMVYQHQKRYKEAINVYEEIISKDKNFYQAYRWCGIVYFIIGDNDNAIKNFKLAADLKPYSEEPLMQMEMAYRKKGDPEETKRVRDEFLRIGEAKLAINPEDGITLSRVAGVYAAQGEKEKAINMVNKVIEIDPEDGLALYNCACVYARLNMKEEALNCLRAVFQRGYKNVRDWVNSDPDFDNLRNDIDFRRIVEE